jgi:hypothetical protein
MQSQICDASSEAPEKMEMSLRRLFTNQQSEIKVSVASLF